MAKAVWYVGASLACWSVSRRISVVRRVAYEEDLAASCISSTPPDKVVCNDKGLLGLARNVSGHHAQTQGLGGPEGESDVVADEKTNRGAEVVIFDSLFPHVSIELDYSRAHNLP